MTARPARRAVVRWALRLLRREWRQHLLVVTLLTVAVGGALFGATAAYNVAPSHDGRFGNATHRFDISVDDRARLDQFVADAAAYFGAAERIAHDALAVAGSTERIDVRWQDPAGSIGAPMLALTDGRYPAVADELALTDGTARLLDTEIGGVVEVAGGRATVVGLVENPDDLDDEFALALPTTGAIPDAATILLQATDDHARSFRSDAAPDQWSIEPRGQSEKTVAAVAILAVATVAMLLVALVAGASFVVIAQRRQRQLGLLAAAGATERHVRLVIIADGAAVGFVAAVAGAAVASVAWLASAPAVERAVGRRLDTFDVPWWVMLGGLALAVTTAVAAAWWPARTISRIPVMAALSGRPPRPRRARRSILTAVVLFGGGITSLVFAADPARDSGNPALMVAGVVATTAGLVLFAPIVVRMASILGRRSPLAARIAVRDLARYQSRSGAALAAISLGLAIVVAIVVISAANEAGADDGNLSDRQVLMHIGDAGSPGNTTLSIAAVSGDDLDEMRAEVSLWAESLDDTTVVPLEYAVDATREVRVDGETRHPTVVLGVPAGDVTRDAGPIYVATPSVLAHLGLDPPAIAPDTVLLTSRDGEVRLTGDITNEVFQHDPVTAVERIETAPPFWSAPRTLITAHGMQVGGWTPAPAGWLVESSQPFTDDQLVAARQMAAEAGLTVEVRDEQQAGLSTLRNAATGIGILVALAILVMTVGLIRAEAAGDVRTLTAVGAASRTRRGVTAWTSGTLALLAAVLGIVCAYAALIAGYTPDVERLDNVPVAHLATIAIGLPLIAAAAAWLLAGRQPRHLGRRPAE